MNAPGSVGQRDLVADLPRHACRSSSTFADDEMEVEARSKMPCYCSLGCPKHLLTLALLGRCRALVMLRR